MGQWCTSMGVGGWIAMAATWITVLALVVWAVSRLFPAAKDRDPRAVLDTRLASGEIDSETYRSLRAQLDGLDSRRAEGRR